jgi:hypothetical protein
MGWVIFGKHIPKKHKHFSIKIYKLCDNTATHATIKVHIGKDFQPATDQIPAIDATVRYPTRRVEGVGYKLAVANILSSPVLFDDLATTKIYSCGTVHLNHKGISCDLQCKTLKMKLGDVQATDLNALVQHDKRVACLLACTKHL